MSFQKLVRDKIPDVIRANGEQPIVRILNDDEYVRELIKKLGEECDEFREAQNLEELADIQEVVLALADVLASRGALEAVRLRKTDERGAFDARVYLEGVE